jgi:hypothetical protein
VLAVNGLIRPKHTQRRIPAAELVIDSQAVRACGPRADPYPRVMQVAAKLSALPLRDIRPNPTGGWRINLNHI